MAKTGFLMMWLKWYEVLTAAFSAAARFSASLFSCSSLSLRGLRWRCCIIACRSSFSRASCKHKQLQMTINLENLHSLKENLLKPSPMEMVKTLLQEQLQSFLCCLPTGMLKNWTDSSFSVYKVSNLSKHCNKIKLQQAMHLCHSFTCGTSQTKWLI